MASGHRDETLDRALAIDSDNLVRGFLLLPPDEEPGTVFAYNQPCTYTAGVIVQRATGQSLTDYLRPRFFDPLGIDDVGWSQDASGFDIGFSGLHASTEAIAALGQFYLQRGEWNGTQLLPASWVDEATTSHISNGSDPASDWSQGYGFQFWMSRHGYRGDGAYGQFAAILPEHDLVIAMTGQSNDMQAILDLAWEHVLPALGSVGDTRGDSMTDAALAAQLATRAIAPLEPGTSDRRVEGSTFSPSAPGGYPALTRILVEPGADQAEVLLTLVELDGRIEVPARFGGWHTSDATSASAGWQADGTRLAVDVIFIETPHRLHIVLDLATSTFETRWETEPLHSPPLSALRRPTSPAPKIVG